MGFVFECVVNRGSVGCLLMTLGFCGRRLLSAEAGITKEVQPH